MIIILIIIIVILLAIIAALGGLLTAIGLALKNFVRIIIEVIKGLF